MHRWGHYALVSTRHEINNVLVCINLIMNSIVTGWYPGGARVVPKRRTGGAQLVPEGAQLVPKWCPRGAQVVPICGHCHHYHTLDITRHSSNIMDCTNDLNYIIDAMR